MFKKKDKTLSSLQKLDTTKKQFGSIEALDKTTQKMKPLFKPLTNVNEAEDRLKKIQEAFKKNFKNPEIDLDKIGQRFISSEKKRLMGEERFQKAIDQQIPFDELSTEKMERKGGKNECGIDSRFPILKYDSIDSDKLFAQEIFNKMYQTLEEPIAEQIPTQLDQIQQQLNQIQQDVVQKPVQPVKQDVLLEQLQNLETQKSPESFPIETQTELLDLLEKIDVGTQTRNIKSVKTPRRKRKFEDDSGYET